MKIARRRRTPDKKCRGTSRDVQKGTSRDKKREKPHDVPRSRGTVAKFVARRPAVSRRNVAGRPATDSGSVARRRKNSSRNVPRCLGKFTEKCRRTSCDCTTFVAGRRKEKSRELPRLAEVMSPKIAKCRKIAKVYRCESPRVGILGTESFPPCIVVFLCWSCCCCL